MQSLLHLLDRHGVPDAAAKTILILALFLTAAVVSRVASVLARRIEAGADSDDLVSPLVALSRRETAVSLVQTTVRYLVYLLALALTVVVLVGGRSIGTVAGASFVAVLIGFAAQRFLIDIMAGFVMFFEGWYTVGTSVVIEPWKLEGVVEEVSLRATTIRDVSGDILRVHNSQILAVRVLPEGSRKVEIELFVHDRDAGQELIQRVAAIVPTGPTSFIDAPRVRDVQQLDDELFRVTAEASVAAGRMWMATDLLPSLLKERAEEGLLVHGPVILPVDEQAASRFARAGLRSRQRAARARS
jgi:small conductance mechanosensitive channel